jgi:hypothetical protein
MTAIYIFDAFFRVVARSSSPGRRCGRLRSSPLRCAPFRLTSIAAAASVGPRPTSPEGEECDVDDSEALPFRGGLGGAAICRRCGRLRSRQNSAALRFFAHIHRPYSRRCRVGCDCRRRRHPDDNKKKVHILSANMCTFFIFCRCREHHAYVPSVPFVLKIFDNLS